MIKVKNLKIETDLVPSPANYSILLPDNYETSENIYPLALILHGGNGHVGFLKGQIRPIIKNMWKNKLLPEMILVTPHCDRSFYMDYRDGSEKWESFIINELLLHLNEQLRVANGPSNTFITGISMGGMGSLRMGFKHLDIFGVIVAFEPAIEPAFEWKNVTKVDKSYRGKHHMEKIFGKPFDEEYWKINNPTFIASEKAKEIRESGVKIYFEVGTEDMLGLYRGGEFLHRVLYDNKINHEFRYVYGANHIGPSLKERFLNGYSFLSRIINNPHPDKNVKILLQKWENNLTKQ